MLQRATHLRLEDRLNLFPKNEDDTTVEKAAFATQTPQLTGEKLARAHWLDKTTIAISKRQFANHEETEVQATLILADKALTATDLTAVSPPDTKKIKLKPSILSESQATRWPHLRGHAVFELETTDLDYQQALRGSIQVLTHQSNTLIGLTGMQIPGIIDTLFSESARPVNLGVSWIDGHPTLRLWAPTARAVKLQLHPSETQLQTYTEYPLNYDEQTGIWEISGDSSWRNCAYRYAVQVFVPTLNEVVTNVVTDPYSHGLNATSSHSVIIDLTDPQLQPDNWETLQIPEVARPVDQMIYELHVRDFSIHDETVPAPWRGTYLAFTATESAGMRHLTRLADAGINSLHLLPTYDIGSIPKPREAQDQPQIPAITDPASEAPQDAINKVASTDGFNWGYDPHHYQVPEGSYSTDASASGKIREFRTMVAALAQTGKHGLRVVADQVFNHLYESDQSEKAVLDRVVPGYYHRLCEDGLVENSTCCANLATEHVMMEKLMVDSVVHWAKHYKVSGFRFDLMGHHSAANMWAVKNALAKLTVATDGIDGQNIHLYGEGWNFGEVADNSRFYQAIQGQLEGSEIGTFNDRIRDSLMGGHHDGFDRTLGWGTGLAQNPQTPLTQTETSRLLAEADVIRLGLAGNLKTYQWETHRGIQSGQTLHHSGRIVGYGSEPAESINYVDAHDNQTLYDLAVIKLPENTSMEDRVRYNILQLAVVAWGQCPAFWHAGTDLLRSKSLDRDSYNSGDYFNAIDWSRRHHNFGVGLPPWERNERESHNWEKMRPLLRNPHLVASPAALDKSHFMALDLLRLRTQLPLLRLGSADLICQKVKFPNQGSHYRSAVIAMHIDDTEGPRCDQDISHLLVAFNPYPEEVSQTYADLAGIDFKLHPILAETTADTLVRKVAWDTQTGTVTLPALTAAVLYAH